jgi:hypothetical protein
MLYGAEMIDMVKRNLKVIIQLQFQMLGRKNLQIKQHQKRDTKVDKLAAEKQRAANKLVNKKQDKALSPEEREQQDKQR